MNPNCLVAYCCRGPTVKTAEQLHNTVGFDFERLETKLAPTSKFEINQKSRLKHEIK